MKVYEQQRGKMECECFASFCFISLVIFPLFFFFCMRSRANTQSLTYLVWCRGLLISCDSQLVIIFFVNLLPIFVKSMAFPLVNGCPMCLVVIPLLFRSFEPVLFSRKRIFEWIALCVVMQSVSIWCCMMGYWLSVSCYLYQSLSCRAISSLFPFASYTQVSYIMAWGIGAFFVGYGQLITLYMWGSQIPLIFCY